jgi:hypothetical protein
MKATSQGLMVRQRENQEKITEIQQALGFQKDQRVRAITRMERYDAELETTERIESELLGKTISRQ